MPWLAVRQGFGVALRALLRFGGIWKKKNKRSCKSMRLTTERERLFALQIIGIPFLSSNALHIGDVM